MWFRNYKSDFELTSFISNFLCFNRLKSTSLKIVEMSSEHTHPFGKPVNVLKFGEGNKVIIDNAELDKMFLHPDVKNRKVVVFSIIGAFRRGKSFFLDYCLRFLYANVSFKFGGFDFFLNR